MGIRNRILNWLSKSPAAGVNVSEFRANQPYSPPDKLGELVKRYTGWVYACVHCNAINCAQQPLRVFQAKESRATKIRVPHRQITSQQRKFLESSPSARPYLRKAVDVEEVTEHPFIDLLSTVNPWMNQFDLLETLFMFLDLTGNEFWLMQKGRNGIPTEIWPLFPQFMKIVPSKQRFVERYEYQIGSSPTPEKFKPEEIVHFKNPNPIDAFWGLGPLRAAIVAADLSIGYDAHEATLMKNGARPDMALVYPVDAGSPPEPDIQSIMGRWRQRHGGKNQGGLAVVTGGAELKQLTLSQREMEFIKGRKMTREELAAIFGVPLSKLTTENVNLANANAGEKQYATDALLPRLRKVEQKINEQIMPAYQQEGLFVAFDNPVPEDAEFALKERDSNIRNGYTSINEERIQSGLEPAPWGDEPGPITIQGGVQDEKPESKPDTDKARRKSLRTLPPLIQPRDFVDESFILSMERWLKNLGQKALENFDTSGEILVQKSALDDWLEGWLDIDELSDDLATRMAPYTRATLIGAGSQAIRTVSDNTDFNPLAPQVSRSLRKHQRGAIVSITATQQKQLRKILAEGIAEGEGIPALRKRLMEKYNEELTRYQATVIARTETIWAFNEGAVQGYIQSGVVTKKEWLTANDDRTCQFCSGMDGTVVGVEMDFFNLGETYRGSEGGLLHFEYENVGHPPLHCQCRCTIVPVVEEF